MSMWARSNDAKRFPCGKQRGFTLVELLVIIGIISMLISFLLPALSKATLSAKSVKCASNLRQIGQAFHLYANTWDGQLPTWSDWHVYPVGSSPDDTPGIAWTVQLMPFFVPPDNAIYNCPGFPPNITMTYFIEARWESLQKPMQNTIKLSQIKYGSQFVLSGDATQENGYARPFGSDSVHTSVDVDKSDEFRLYLIFQNEMGGLNVHPGGNNILFSDGHVAMFHEYDPQAMTYDPANMANWSDLQKQ